ncbi:hypothetical protein OGAPHI_006444 [Ogataea philodendri]|uniref:nicotinamidase n=1 Tax=Ogataea philodendri TaxID=1378263 RepID=A0A9P8T1E7_9ASCO|nr:uncharacterized protein OGAPHI_006444 [Ogataea philodendri]KAH3661596.1 hypothetical protein OGAPHI_006444 [Ogataea philodendri]
MSQFKPALIIVDLQEDFLPPDGALAVSEGRATIELILGLLDLKKYDWKTIIATLDWHPQDHTSFASNHGAKPFTTKQFKHPLEDSYKEQVLWPDHCVQNSAGSEFAREFKPVFTNILETQPVPTYVVKKGYLQDREYYSCFQDTWGVHHTECEKLLKENGITHVYTVGLAYDYCVLNSSLDAANLGYTTFVLKDCSRSVDPSKNEQTDSTYSQHGVKIITTSDPALAKVEV